MRIHKFGGSSVNDADAITHVARIIHSLDSEGDKPIVVVSALGGVTDELIRLMSLEDGGDVRRSLVNIAARHLGVLRAVALPEEHEECSGAVQQLMVKLTQAVQNRSLKALVENKSYADAVTSFGERLSVVIVSAAFRAAGMQSVPVDARFFMKTDSDPVTSHVLFDSSYRLMRDVLPKLLEQNIVPVVTGFIAEDIAGKITTLGRGGSDYTATLLAAALSADEVVCWKGDVDGILSADPRIVPEAALLPHVTYDEAGEMANWGANVLHPKTMRPLIPGGIPLRVQNTFAPEESGTVIGTETTETLSGVKVVSADSDVAMVTIEGKGMFGSMGFAGQVFTLAGKLGVNTLMFMQSSEQSICIVVEASHAEPFAESLRAALCLHHGSLVDSVIVDQDIAAVAIVGEGMRKRTGVLTKLTSAIEGSGLNIRASVQGSSKRSISVIVDQEQADFVVRLIHKVFNLGETSLTIC